MKVRALSQWLPGWVNGREQMPDVFFYALIFAVAYFIVWYFKRLRTANITEGMTKAEEDMKMCYDSTHTGEDCKNCEDVEKHYRSKGWKADYIKYYCEMTNKDAGFNLFGLDPNAAIQQAVDYVSLGKKMFNREDLKDECRPRLLGQKLQKVVARGNTQTVDSKAGIYKTNNTAQTFVDQLNSKLGTVINKPDGMCYKVTDNFEILKDCTSSKFVEYVHPSNDDNNILSNAVQQSLNNKIYYDDYYNIIDWKEDNADEEPDFKTGDVQNLKSFMESPPSEPSDSFKMYYKNKNNDSHGFIRLEHMKCCTGSKCGGSPSTSSPPLGPPPLGSPPVGPPPLGSPSAGPPSVGPPPLGSPPLGSPPLGPPSLGPPSLGPPSVGPPSVGPPPLGPPPTGPPPTGPPPAGPPPTGPPPTGTTRAIPTNLEEAFAPLAQSVSAILQPVATSGFTQQREGLQTQDDEDSACCSTDCEAIPHADIYKDDRTGQNLQKNYAYICKYKHVDGFSPRVKKMCNWWNKLTTGCQVDVDEKGNPKPYIAQKIDQWRCNPDSYIGASQIYDEHKGVDDKPFEVIKERDGDMCKP